MAGRSSIRAIKYIYDVTISGQTFVVTLTNQADAITEWINGVKAADGNAVVRKVGFELEFHRNTAPIGTLQLCVDRRCLVLHLVGPPGQMPWPPSLNLFLASSNNIFEGIQMEIKLNMLSRQVPIVAVELIRTVELLKNLPWLCDNKEKIFAMYGLGPGTVENDWGRRHSMLSDEQVHYACLDAILNLKAALSPAHNC